MTKRDQQHGASGNPLELLATGMQSMTAPLKALLDTHAKFVEQNSKISENLLTLLDFHSTLQKGMDAESRRTK